MQDLLLFIAYICMLVLFVALVASLSIAYKLFQIVKNRDAQERETNKILNELREQVTKLKDNIHRKS